MVGVGMVEIPAGRFRMGSAWKVNSPKSAYSFVYREHHLKTVRLDP
jgi:formylglycine-generating enzyme required for sulfatase activity